MRYVMLTYNGEQTLRWWEAASQEERQAEVERTVARFQEHGAKGRIVGGEELGSPKDATTIRSRGVSDGPFIETKELLGGFVVLEVPDEAAALEIARGWPGLVRDDVAVELPPSAIPLPKPGCAEASAGPVMPSWHRSHSDRAWIVAGRACAGRVSQLTHAHSGFA